MKMSDRDKLLILVLVLAAVVLLPVFLFIRPKMQDIKAMNAELESLEGRYQELKKLSEKKPFYTEETERLKNERENMQEGFAEDIIQENTIVFIDDIENNFPMYIFDEKFEDYQYTEVEPGLSGLKAQTVISFECKYDKFLQLLDHVFSQENKMNIYAITADWDEGYGLVKGEFTLEEFAFVTEESHVERRNIPALRRGQNYNLFCHIEPQFVLDENGESLIVLVEDPNDKKKKDDKQKVDNDNGGNND